MGKQIITLLNEDTSYYMPIIHQLYIYILSATYELPDHIDREKQKCHFDLTISSLNPPQQHHFELLLWMALVPLS